MQQLTFIKVSFLLSVALCAATPALALDVERQEVRQFIDRMVEEHDYDRDALTAVLQQAETQQSILDAIARPAERTKAWHEYRDIFLTDERVEAGAEFWRTHKDALQRISKETGVSCEILVGIIGVETYFGRITGRYRVLDALSTLAFDYPPRSKFFSRELEQFLLLVREEGMDASEATGSYAGAMGAPQFMPSSFRAYAVDTSKDGRRDIWTDWQDVIGSVANYFVEHGWKSGNPVVTPASLGSNWEGTAAASGNSLSPEATVESLSRQGVVFATDLPGDQESQLLVLEGEQGDEYWVGFHNFFVITRYNRSVMYALAVHQLGQEIALEVGRSES
ncbi:MAG TPA: lytic murein transglycosylase B [Woeseiaceae bacterium]|nr:lytic murein transglycosylase B [Woeseiaceae bacterium]